MDAGKIDIVMRNYFADECDVDTTIRQAYERGFRRGVSKCKCTPDDARLDELLAAVREFVEDSDCDKCQMRRDCNDNNRMFCGDELSYHAFARLRELAREA